MCLLSFQEDQNHNYTKVVTTILGIPQQLSVVMVDTRAILE